MTRRKPARCSKCSRPLFDAVSKDRGTCVGCVVAIRVAPSRSMAKRLAIQTGQPVVALQDVPLQRPVTNVPLLLPSLDDSSNEDRRKRWDRLHGEKTRVDTAVRVKRWRSKRPDPEERTRPRREG